MVKTNPTKLFSESAHTKTSQNTTSAIHTVLAFQLVTTNTIVKMPASVFTLVFLLNHV